MFISWHRISLSHSLGALLFGGSSEVWVSGGVESNHSVIKLLTGSCLNATGATLNISAARSGTIKVLYLTLPPQSRMCFPLLLTLAYCFPSHTTIFV